MANPHKLPRVSTFCLKPFYRSAMAACVILHTILNLLSVLLLLLIQPHYSINSTIKPPLCIRVLSFRSPRRRSRAPVPKPTCLRGERDGARHLLARGEGEMTFERRAKCECSLHSCAAVRSDHCYFSRLSKEGFRWLAPLFFFFFLAALRQSR